MSNAEELLNTLSDEAVAEAGEPHIVVDLDRTIYVPDELKKIAVQHDHRIRTVTFDVPKMWDGIDISGMQIFVNYKNGNSEGTDRISEVVVDGDIFHFDWTITKDVTGTAGNIEFSICAKLVDAEGNEERHWNSEPNDDLIVSRGLETGDVVVNKYPGVIADIYSKLENVATVDAVLAALPTWNGGTY